MKDLAFAGWSFKWPELFITVTVVGSWWCSFYSDETMWALQAGPVRLLYIRGACFHEERTDQGRRSEGTP